MTTKKPLKTQTVPFIRLSDVLKTHVPKKYRAEVSEKLSNSDLAWGSDYNDHTLVDVSLFIQILEGTLPEKLIDKLNTVLRIPEARHIDVES